MDSIMFIVAPAGGTHFRYMAGNESTAECYYFPCFSGARGEVVMGQQY